MPRRWAHRVISGSASDLHFQCGGVSPRGGSQDMAMAGGGLLQSPGVIDSTPKESLVPQI